MIVEEIEMPSSQALDLSQRIIHALSVEPSATVKECILVAEVTMLRAPTRHDYGIRHQIIVTPDEIAAQCGNAFKCAACGGGVNALRFARAKVFQELGEG